MPETEQFAHGYHYGDYSGVVFYGASEDGITVARLAVSDCYIDPLFRALLERCWRDSAGERIPRLAVEWNSLEGWRGCPAGRVLVSQQEMEELATMFIRLTTADLAQHCAGSTPDECLRCAVVIKEFVDSQLSRNAILYIEDD